MHREKIHQQQTADKNVGYVCVDKSDLLAQYDKINDKQHFGKTQITEDWKLEQHNGISATSL